MFTGRLLILRVLKAWDVNVWEATGMQHINGPHDYRLAKKVSWHPMTCLLNFYSKWFCHCARPDFDKNPKTSHCPMGQTVDKCDHHNAKRHCCPLRWAQKLCLCKWSPQTTQWHKQVPYLKSWVKHTSTSWKGIAWAAPFGLIKTGEMHLKLVLLENMSGTSCLLAEYRGGRPHAESRLGNFRLNSAAWCVHLVLKSN